MNQVEFTANPLKKGTDARMEIQPGEFIQVLNTGQVHWVTISTIGASHPTVHVYDYHRHVHKSTGYHSLYSCAGTHLKAQIAAVLATEKPELVIEFMDVPIQITNT